MVWIHFSLLNYTINFFFLKNENIDYFFPV
jgi:hypothetical protein